jgi:hypothetical protein
MTTAECKVLKTNMQRTDLSSLDLLAQKSLQQYGAIFEFLQSTGLQFGTHSTGHIKKFDETLVELQEMAKQTDQQLTEKLRVVEITENITESLARRTELQEKILVLLKEKISRVNSAKSLLASEMQSIKNGRKALTGYRTNSDHQGRIIDKTS